LGGESGGVRLEEVDRVWAVGVKESLAGFWNKLVISVVEAEEGGFVVAGVEVIPNGVKLGGGTGMLVIGGGLLGKDGPKTVVGIGLLNSAVFWSNFFWTLTRRSLYRSNNSVASKNASASTAVVTADRKDTLSPRREV
jgi:hypothetical protein